MAKKRTIGDNPMPPQDVVGGTVYMKHTSSAGGSYITEHRVWDAKLFIQTQFETNEEIKRTRKKSDPEITLEQVTEEDYKAQQKAARRG